MSLRAKNPFAGCDGICSSDQLIGRTAMVQTIETLLLHNQRNMSLYGMLHIGKTSVVYVAIAEKSGELHEEGILPILLDLSTYVEPGQSPDDFFRLLVELCAEKLLELDRSSEPIRLAAQAVLESCSVARTERFFTRVKQAGIRVLFLLDKFDSITTIFGSNSVPYQRLQALSENPACRVTLLTISERPLHEIVPVVAGISRFEKTFPPYPLSVFDEQDMQHYIELLASVTNDSSTFPITPELKEALERSCGRHPYLLMRTGYELVEAFLRTGQVDHEQVLQQLDYLFIRYSIDLKRSLSAYKLLDKLIQIVVGPVINITFDDEETLLRYGLIKLNESRIVDENGVIPKYLAFCSHLQTYLKLVDMDDQTLLWRRTEQTLRTAIAGILQRSYGEGWFDELERRYQGSEWYQGSDGREMFHQCREAQKRAIRYQETRPAHNLLEHTQPRHLFDIMLDRSQWESTFQSRLGKTYHYWKDCAIVLGRVRNPIAHNRSYATYEQDRKEAERYCREILRIFSDYAPAAP